MNWRVGSATTSQGSFPQGCKNPELTSGLCAVSIKSHRSRALQICKQTVAHAQGRNIRAIPVLVTKATEHNQQHIVNGSMPNLSHQQC